MQFSTPLAERIEKLFPQKLASYGPEFFEAFNELKEGLNSGAIRAAQPDAGADPAGWRVNAWVKMGILIGFRIGVIENMSADHGRLPFFDKSTFPLKKLSVDSGVRIVPGGSSIREGCFIARGVTCMPPMYINVGSYVDEGTMIDSHALVGSCAQVGKRVHLSAASQLCGHRFHALALPGQQQSPAVGLQRLHPVSVPCGFRQAVPIGRQASLLWAWRTRFLGHLNTISHFVTQ